MLFVQKVAEFLATVTEEEVAAAEPLVGVPLEGDTLSQTASPDLQRLIALYERMRKISPPDADLKMLRQLLFYEMARETGVYNCDLGVFKGWQFARGPRRHAEPIREVVGFGRDAHIVGF